MKSNFLEGSSWNDKFKTIGRVFLQAWKSGSLGFSVLFDFCAPKPTAKACLWDNFMAPVRWKFRIFLNYHVTVPLSLNMDDFVSNSNLIVQRDFSFPRKIPRKIEDYAHVWHTAIHVIICIQNDCYPKNNWLGNKRKVIVRGQESFCPSSRQLSLLCFVLCSQPGEFQNDPYDNCTIYSCVNIHDQFISSTSEITCPAFNEDNCKAVSKCGKPTL